MQRFELGDKKFFFVDIVENTLVTVSGKPGQKTEARTQMFANAAAAKAAGDKLIAEKVKKGYKETTGGGGGSSSAAAADEDEDEGDEEEDE